jgi:putative ABC transport system ATP-binding protein
LLSSSRNLELTRLNDRGLTNYRRRYVGFVFQFDNLVPMPTAYENAVLAS